MFLRRFCQRFVKFRLRAAVHAHIMCLSARRAFRTLAKRRALIMNYGMAFVAQGKHVVEFLNVPFRIETPFFVRFQPAIASAADTAFIICPLICVAAHYVPRGGGENMP